MAHIELTRIPLHARRTAANRPDTSPHVLELLSADPDAGVRYKVASHPATPLESLQRLALDAVNSVASRARIAALAKRMAG
ncbi:MAG TPA: hypothetical protein VK070_05720 [Acidimicrobiia bacterium]|nr:hypothetical protein [Acidimicrobiia bacterium]